MGLNPFRFLLESGYQSVTVIVAAFASTSFFPILGIGDHCPGPGSRRTSPFAATRRPH